MNTKERILQISYENKLSHLGSCMSALDIIESIYDVKDADEKFVLSGGHAGLALYVVLEKHGLVDDAEEVLHRMGIHPERSREDHIDASTGSLGQGLPIAVGMALGDRSKNVYCTITDGEMAEGSIWESLRIMDKFNITNLKVVVNANGWSAYDSVDPYSLQQAITGFGLHCVVVDGHDQETLKKALNYDFTLPTVILAKTSVERYTGLEGLDAHYKVLTKEQYEGKR